MIARDSHVWMGAYVWMESTASIVFVHLPTRENAVRYCCVRFVNFHTFFHMGASFLIYARKLIPWRSSKPVSFWSRVGRSSYWATLTFIVYFIPKSASLSLEALGDITYKILAKLNRIFRQKRIKAKRKPGKPAFKQIFLKFEIKLTQNKVLFSLFFVLDYFVKQACVYLTFIATIFSDFRILLTMANCCIYDNRS